MKACFISAIFVIMPKKICGTNNVLLTRLQPGKEFQHATTIQKDYAASLHIPPKWAPAYVCTGDKITWMAQDGKGKWQYGYSAAWTSSQEHEKIRRLHGLDAAFWTKFKKRLSRDLAPTTTTTAWTRTRLLALAARILYMSNFRVGKKANTKSDHYGLMTINSLHITSSPNNNNLCISFIGKSGKENSYTITDHNTVDLLKDLLKNVDSNATLFTYSEADLRTYLSSIKMGLRPKDFRTYKANYILFDMLKHTNPTKITLQSRKAMLRGVYKTIAHNLYNTPAVVKRSYVYSGFSEMYMNKPDLFEQIMVAKSTTNILNSFIKTISIKNTE